MKRFFFIASFIFVSVWFAAAQDAEAKPAALVKKASLHALAALGAGLILNSGGASGFAYGGGVRWVSYFKGKSAFVLGAEYSRRGADWKLDCLDFKASILYGTTLFAETGIYVSPILSTAAGSHGWDRIASVDAGYHVGFGYQFPIGLTIAATAQGGFADLSGDSYFFGRDGYLSQLNLCWGGFISVKLF